jgi:hypothetical protein
VWVVFGVTIIFWALFAGGALTPQPIAAQAMPLPLPLNGTAPALATIDVRRLNPAVAWAMLD